MSGARHRAGVGAIVAACVSVGSWGIDRAVTGPASPPSVADGARLFHAKGCAGCHVGPSSTTPLGSTFPSLADAAAWAGERRPGMSARDYLAESIAAPDAFVAPGRAGSTLHMPRLRLEPAEIDALVDHLLTGN